jgi:hypothetical protein
VPDRSGITDALRALGRAASVLTRAGGPDGRSAPPLDLATGAAVAAHPDWVWPAWVERQADPASDAWVPLAPDGRLRNQTTRQVTLLGDVFSRHLATVDPAGMVTPWGRGWSLDWWVRVGGVWRYPSREPDVTQTLYGGTPVVQTRLPVGEGDVVARAYAHVASGVPGGEVVACEVENRSGRGVQVAFVLRPVDHLGIAHVHDVVFAGTTVTVDDGAVALLLPGQPRGVVLSGADGGDVAHHLAAGLAHGARRSAVHDPNGLATAAFVLDLPAGDRVRAAAPLGRGTTAGAGGGTTVATLRSAEEVAEAWEVPLTRGMQVLLPDIDLQLAFDAARATQLLAHGPGHLHRGLHDRQPLPDGDQLTALTRVGLHDEVADVLRATLGGAHTAGDAAPQAWAEIVSALAEHVRHVGATDLLDAHAPAVAAIAGRLTAAVRAPGPRIPDRVLVLQGLRDAMWLAYQRGDVAGAEALQHVLRTGEADLSADVERARRRLGVRGVPVSPERMGGADLVEVLRAAARTDVLAADSVAIEETAEAVRDRACHGPAVLRREGPSGLDVRATLDLAAVELAAGDARVWDRIAWALEVATGTWSWPTLVHPRHRGGCGGEGADAGVAAAFLAVVRDALVRDTPAGDVALLSVLPDAWFGEEVHVHGAPTRSGRVSFRLSWHEDAPRLWWSCERPGVRLSAPGLDDRWSSTEREGSTSFSGTEV